MKIYDTKDFGTTGDGVTLNTAAIQKAIDTCAEQFGRKEDRPSVDSANEKERNAFQNLRKAALFFACFC